MKDFIEMFADNWIGRILGIFVLAALGVCGYYLFFTLTHKCLVSHEEIQYQAPISTVVGGGSNGGGMAIPLGNIRPIKVMVCDKYD